MSAFMLNHICKMDSGSRCRYTMLQLNRSIFKSSQFNRRAGVSRWSLRAPYLQFSCSENENREWSWCQLFHHWHRELAAMSPGVGITKAPFVNFHKRKIVSMQKHRFHPGNHIHICWVSPQLSCGDTRQMWIRNAISNWYLYHFGKRGK